MANDLTITGTAPINWERVQSETDAALADWMAAPQTAEEQKAQAIRDLKRGLGLLE